MNKEEYTDAKQINFRVQDVRAILSGAKTVFRRPTKANFCRYKVGDILWVREEFLAVERQALVESGYIYKATHPHDPAIKWRPTNMMPKAAARIFLRVLSVQKQELHDITPSEIKKEGLVSTQLGILPTRFATLWDQIYGKGSFDANPEVWRIEFERV
jgi:hypothetical protein